MVTSEDQSKEAWCFFSVQLATAARDPRALMEKTVRTPKTPRPPPLLGT